MTSTDSRTEGRQRQLNEDIADRKDIRDALKDVVKGIHDLQKEAVFLKAQLATAGSLPEHLTPRIISLGHDVRAAAIKLEDVVATLPDRQKEHGRVKDVQRSLMALEASLPRLP